MKKVLFIDTTHPILPAQLEELGFECHHFPSYIYSDYLSVIQEYTGVVIRSKIKIDEKFLMQATQLKFIARVGAGMENIDVAKAESLGIKCLNSPEGNRDALAEHAVGMILALRNHLIRVDAEVRLGVWRREENRGFEMMGKTIGLIGYGFMGQAFAQRLQGFGMNILVYDKYKANFNHHFVTEVSLDEIFRQADIVSFHVPLTPETNYMFNKKWIQEMAKPFYLINTSRGLVVNTNDLMDGIDEGKVLGAALDVLEFEETSFENLNGSNLPEAYQRLIKSDRVILSPHIAGWSVESNIKLSTFLVDKIAALQLT